VLGVVPATRVIPAGIIEHDGMLWKPRRGATASAEEFIAARALFIELNNDAVWNPWVREERAADIDEGAEVMSQWQRAEPGHRHLSLKQWESRQERRERQQEQQRAKDEARRDRDKARYDEQRSTARLRLIEVRSRLDFEIAELAGFREGTKYPAMEPKRRANEIEELEQKVERLRAEVDRLTPIVDDPEDVVDQHGWLPRDRREHTWWSYRLVRERKVRDLKRQVPELEAALKATTDRTERRERRAKLAEATTRVTEFVNNTDTAGPMGGGMGGPGGGIGGGDGSMCHWMSALDEAGCGAGVNLKETGGPGNDGKIGSGGGYGGFYCFALTP